jgi:hypothetical protein
MQAPKILQNSIQYIVDPHACTYVNALSLILLILPHVQYGMIIICLDAIYFRKEATKQRNNTNYTSLSMATHPALTWETPLFCVEKLMLGSKDSYGNLRFYKAGVRTIFCREGG